MGGEQGKSRLFNLLIYCLRLGVMSLISLGITLILVSLAVGLCWGGYLIAISLYKLPYIIQFESLSEGTNFILSFLAIFLGVKFANLLYKGMNFFFDMVGVNFEVFVKHYKREKKRYENYVR